MNTPQVSKYLIKGEMQGEEVMNNLREFLHRLTISGMGSAALKIACTHQ